ncbi:MAG: sugar kinase [Spirochaetae bacterium HGW-Spirochaetae-9]|nr:MAG: sugar kinase [Spirochaetae bacterium HGW-Spirochaetae-9]
MSEFVTFGEIMARIDMPLKKRFRQALPGSVDISFAGAEANVAAFLSYGGRSAAFVTAMPKNDIAEACIGVLRAIGIETGHIVRTEEGRLGTYYVEEGANQRPSKVIYDRGWSSISLTPPASYAWDEIFTGARWYHFTGITPALSRIAADAMITAAKTAKSKGLSISCDLNFRKNLWKWEKGRASTDLASAVMKEVLPYVDILIGNEEDASDVLGIKAGNTDVTSGSLSIGSYPDVAAKIIAIFPNIKKVAFTLRESVSASHNRWGAMLYDAASKKAFLAPESEGKYSPYEITDIVDRIGGGDSFSAALIYALSTAELSADSAAVRFAAAASCLTHSIRGDFNYSSVDEILALMRGNASGRVVR